MDNKLIKSKCGCLIEMKDISGLNFIKRCWNHRLQPPLNNHGEEVCIECGETPQDFIPVCDFHSDNRGDQFEVMSCDNCHTCDECQPRKYWDEE